MLLNGKESNNYNSLYHYYAEILLLMLNGKKRTRWKDFTISNGSRWMMHTVSNASNEAR